MTDTADNSNKYRFAYGYSALEHLLNKDWLFPCHIHSSVVHCEKHKKTRFLKHTQHSKAIQLSSCSEEMVVL